MGHAATSSAPKASLAKTARKYVLPVKTVTTVTPSMASALTATLAGLGTGRWPFTQALCFYFSVAATLTSSYCNAVFHTVIMIDSPR